MFSCHELRYVAYWMEAVDWVNAVGIKNPDLSMTSIYVSVPVHVLSAEAF